MKTAPSPRSPDTLALLAARRSVPVKTMTDPGPDEAALDDLLRIAARVPDHRMVVPFRFVVFDRAAGEAMGDALEAAFRAREPAAPDEKTEEARRLFARAPVMVTVLSAPDPNHKTPVWEQELTAGAVCQNLLVAAEAAGWAAQWLTGWPAYDARVAAAMGVRASERVAGFIHLGTRSVAPQERPRPDLAAITTRWSAP